MLMIISFTSMPVSAVSYTHTYGNDKVIVSLYKTGEKKAQASTVVTGDNGGYISVSLYLTYKKPDQTYAIEGCSGGSYQNGVTISCSVPSNGVYTESRSFHTAKYYGFNYNLKIN